MTDGIIKGTGTSRKLQGTLPSSYSAFVSAVAAGTQTIDMLFNSGGWQQQPTFLNKANLLTDAVATAYGLTPNATPNDVLNAARTLITAAQTTADGRARCASGSYTGTGVYGTSNKNTITFSFQPKFVIIKEPGSTSANGYGGGLTAFFCQSASSPTTQSSTAGGFDGSCQDDARRSFLNGRLQGTGNVTLSWYNSNSARQQMNASGTTYYYVAIG